MLNALSESSFSSAIISIIWSANQSTKSSCWAIPNVLARLITCSRLAFRSPRSILQYIALSMSRTADIWRCNICLLSLDSLILFANNILVYFRLDNLRQKYIFLSNSCFYLWALIGFSNRILNTNCREKNIPNIHYVEFGDLGEIEYLSHYLTALFLCRAD